MDRDHLASMEKGAEVSKTAIMQPFVSDRVVSVGDFRKQALDLATGRAFDPNNFREDMLNRVDCPPDVLEELEQDCKITPTSLLPDEEMPINDDPFDASALEDMPDGLETIRIAKSEREKRTADYHLKQVFTNTLKYNRINFNITSDYRNVPIARASYVPPDVILTVHLMKPHNRMLQPHEVRLGRLMKPDSCFLVLGDTELTKLRDRINCSSDLAVCTDYSEDPRGIQSEFSRDSYPSNFFFFYDTFYNDDREENSIDLSEVVRDWGRRRNYPLKSRSMVEARFAHLKLRLGQPYLYFHQGSCEHLVVISDIRTMIPDDCQQPESYPIQILNKAKRRVPCCACKIYTAKWVTHDDELLPMDPGFFCDECFYRFHYDDKGAKVASFKALPYFDRSALN